MNGRIWTPLVLGALALFGASCDDGEGELADVTGVNLVDLNNQNSLIMCDCWEYLEGFESREFCLGLRTLNPTLITCWERTYPGYASDLADRYDCLSRNAMRLLECRRAATQSCSESITTACQSGSLELDLEPCPAAPEAIDAAMNSENGTCLAGG